MNQSGDANGGGNAQVCREYLRGECDRGAGCKFSHPNDKEGSNDMKDKVCRDFLRDECSRGDRCIFEHPDGKQGTGRVVKFCHNFQNGNCPRTGCTYLHCTQAEEEYYNESGKLPPGVDDVLKVEQNKKVCKDFLNGKCFRSVCKFLHPPPEGFGPFERGPPRKRPMPPWEDEFYPPSRDDREKVRSLMRMVTDLEDENMVLRHKLSRMHRQVLDLTDDNKVVLDENRRLRAADPEPARDLPRRAEPPASGGGSLDTFLRDRPPVSRVPAALDPVSSRAAAARNAAYDGYGDERPSYESRLSSNYDY